MLDLKTTFFKFQLDSVEEENLENSDDVSNKESGSSDDVSNKESGSLNDLSNDGTSLQDIPEVIEHDMRRHYNPSILLRKLSEQDVTLYQNIAPKPLYHSTPKRRSTRQTKGLHPVRLTY